MDEFDFFIDEDEFETFIDHEVGFEDAFDHDLAWAETYLSQWG